ncbi:EAL domain-containing protein [Enterobacteriaceae bacterium LUAb1]
MKNNNTFALCWQRRLATRWWGLPLILPFVFLPLSAYLSTQLMLPDGYVYLIYLPLAMMIALLMVFSWAALPGIILALLVRYVPLYGGLYAAFIVGGFLCALILCWWGYRTHAGKRWGVSFGELRLAPVRLFWLVLVLPGVLIVLMQLMVILHLVPAYMLVFGHEPLTLRNLINYQAVLISSIALTQINYCLIRMIKSPRFALLLWQRLKRQIAPEVTGRELVIWTLLLLGLILFLTHRNLKVENLLLADYTLTMLLPSMLWSAMRFGYLFTTLSWAFILQVLYQFHERFLTSPASPQSMAVVSSNMLVFTVTLFLVAAVCMHQRRLHIFVRRAALSDPIIGLPNLRALIRDLSLYPVSLLCFLRIPELDLLGRTYGLQLRIKYKRELSEWLQPDLLTGEGMYQLPGLDLVLRLNHDALQSRLEMLEIQLRNYRLTWNGLPLHPRIGISFCTVRHPIVNLYGLLGELSEVAEMSLQSGRAENLMRRNALSAVRNLEDKVRLLHEVQTALTHDHFLLFAQKVEGVRGDYYHEILLRLRNQQGEDIKPARFLPIIYEFGLTWEMDNWVLNHTLTFIDKHRLSLTGSRFSVNIFACSLCRPRFAHELAEKLIHWQVEPWQIIIQVNESQILSDFSWGNRTLAQLREMGCLVALDDYGAVYSSYTRLNDIYVDMLKIEGRFVKRMLTSSLDYQIIKSICTLAKIKKTQVIACNVETNEEIAELKRMGIDYIQGNIIGTPHLLYDCIHCPPGGYILPTHVS